MSEAPATRSRGAPAPADGVSRARAWRALAVTAGTLALAVGLPAGSSTDAVVVVAVVAAAAGWPGFALAAFLVLAPWFGHQATTVQYVQWLALTGALGVGLGVSPRLPRGRPGHPVLLLASLYLAASMASLLTLPVWTVWDGWRALEGPELARVFARAHDEQLERSLVSVLFTANGVVVAAAMTWLGAAGGAWRRRWAIALATSLGVAVVAGLADFYGWFDLRAWRPLDRLVNVGQYLRLQSTFGHPGWFGEFLTLAAPWLVVLLLLPVGTAARTAALLAGLAVVQWTLVLSYQRGAWVAHLVTLTGLAVALARTWRDDGRSRSLWRAAALMGAGLVLAAALVAMADLVRGTNFTARVAAIGDRALRVTQADDRLPYVEVGWRLGRLWPVLGGGSESFGFRYRDEFLRPGGAYAREGTPPLRGGYGSAHNVYAQIFAGKGLVGLGLLLAICVVVGRVSRRVARDPARPLADALAAVAAATGIAGFLVHGLVQEFFYVPSLEYLFWAIVGMAAALEAPRPVASARRRLAWSLLAAAIALHAVHAFVVPGRTGARIAEARITARGERLSAQQEDEADGVPFRWTAARAVVPVRPSASLVSLTLKGASRMPQRVTLAVDGQTFATLDVDGTAWRRTRVQLPRRRHNSEPYRLEIRVDPIWTDPVSGAVRGVKVAEYVVR